MLSFPKNFSIPFFSGFKKNSSKSSYSALFLKISKISTCAEKVENFSDFSGPLFLSGKKIKEALARNIENPFYVESLLLFLEKKAAEAGDQDPLRSSLEESFKEKKQCTSLNKNSLFPLLERLQGSIENFFHLFRVLASARRPNSYFEATYLLGLFLQLFSAIQATILLSYQAFRFFLGKNSSMAALFCLSGAVVGVAQKVFSKGSLVAPFGQVLEASLLRERFKTTYTGREELKTLEEHLKKATASFRQHPVLVGGSGSGKTELIYALAKDLQLKKESQEVLYINAGELIRKDSPFHLFDPLEQLVSVLKGKEKRVVVCFDEFHALLKDESMRERFLSLLDTGGQSFIKTVLVTDTESFKKYVENTPFERRLCKIDVPFLKERDLEEIIHLEWQEALGRPATKSELQEVEKKAREACKNEPGVPLVIFLKRYALEKIAKISKTLSGEVWAQRLEKIAEKEKKAGRVFLEGTENEVKEAEACLLALKDLKEKIIAQKKQAEILQMKHAQWSEIKKMLPSVTTAPLFTQTLLAAVIEELLAGLEEELVKLS